MEAAEHEFLRRLGLSVMSHDGNVPISWPRVAAACDYSMPAHFGDELSIEVSIERLGEKSVKYRFIVRRNEQQLALGTMTSVCCQIIPGEIPRSISIPATMRALLASTMPAE
jgi:4-hydroxybenzoyl-CoA thioesterase/acyl-CoA thioester hydrolase